MFDGLESYDFGDFVCGESPFIVVSRICDSFAIAEFFGEDVVVAGDGIAVAFSELVAKFTRLLKSNAVNDDTTVFIM